MTANVDLYWISRALDGRFTDGTYPASELYAFLTTVLWPQGTPVQADCEDVVSLVVAALDRQGVIAFERYMFEPDKFIVPGTKKVIS